jgi:hypothetical protein
MPNTYQIVNGFESEDIDDSRSTNILAYMYAIWGVERKQGIKTDIWNTSILIDFSAGK